MEIKVCGMLSEANIKEIQALFLPNYFGFITYSASPRYVQPDLLEDLGKIVHRRIQKVLVTVDAELVDIIDWADRLGSTIIQLHGNEDPSLCAKLKSAGFTVWKAIGIQQVQDVSKTAPYELFVDRFLFDTKSVQKGGTGLAFDWTVLSEYTSNVPFMLSGGLAPGMESLLIETFKHNVKCVGLDLNSKFELKPGIKNPNQLYAFVQKIAVAYENA